MPDKPADVNTTQALTADLLESRGAAFLKLLSIATAIVVDGEKALRDAGQKISIKEWDALAMAGAYGPLRPSDLLRKVVLSGTPQTLSSVLDRLESRGLIERNPDPTDSRSILVSSTRAGDDLIEDVFPILDRKLILPFNLHFDEEQLEQLHDLLERF